MMGAATLHALLAGDRGGGAQEGRQGRQGRRRGGGGLKFSVREEGVAEPVAVSIHPSSVNAKATRFESRYLVYAEMVKTTQVGSRG